MYLCRCVQDVPKAIIHHLAARHVVFPSTVEELTRNAACFEKYVRGKHGQSTPGLPQIVAAADGTHIPIRKPNGTGDSFINRKGFFSLNVHAICDHSMRFIDVITGYSGRCHDQRVFSEGVVGTSLHSGGPLSDLFRSGARVISGVRVPFIIVADSAYTCTEFVLPAVKQQSANTPKKSRFNKKHASTRNVIERSFGVLKRRWQCLLSAMELNLLNVVDVISACFILHNICIDRNEPLDDEEQLVSMYEEVYGDVDGGAMDGGEEKLAIRNLSIDFVSTLEV